MTQTSEPTAIWCCTPRASRFYPYRDIHVAGCLRGLNGLSYDHDSPKNLGPFPERAPVRPVEEREAETFRDRPRRRYRRPRLNCTGFVHTCPDKGCETCLF